MSRNSRSNTPIYALLALVLVQFVALAALLAAYDGRKTEPTPPAAQEAQEAALSAEEENIPAWLEPAEETVTEKEPPEDALSAPDILADASLIAHGMGAVAAPEDGAADSAAANGDPDGGASGDEIGRAHV